MVNAGYSPGEAPQLFEHLKRDLELRQVKEPFFFGSHPKLQERVESYQELIESLSVHQRRSWGGSLSTNNAASRESQRGDGFGDRPLRLG